MIWMNVNENGYRMIKSKIDDVGYAWLYWSEICLLYTLYQNKIDNK